jgi:uncharacterized protein (DUF983 family)
MAGKRIPKVTWGQAVKQAKEKAEAPPDAIMIEEIPDPYPLGYCQKCGNSKMFRHYFHEHVLHRECRSCKENIII